MLDVLLSCLSENLVTTEIEHLIRSAPFGRKYFEVKSALLKFFSDTQEQRFRKLVSGLELGDRRPSQLFMEMQRLSGGLLDPAFVRMLWLGRLPPRLQIALISLRNDTDNAIIHAADQAWEIDRISGPQIAATHVSRKSSHEEKDVLSLIQQQLRDLALEVKHLRERSSSRSRSPSAKTAQTARAHDNINNNNLRAKEGNASESICFFHRRYHAKARKCVKPCSWKPEN